MDSTAALPSETLLEIFHAVRLVNGIPLSSYVDSNRATLKQAPSSFRTYLIGWINITFVCARWRKLALSDASLWTEVPVVLGNEWLSEFLQRSQDMSVSIDWHRQRQTTRVSETFLRAILPHFQRFRNFHAQLQSTSPFYAMLSCPWPVLEDLQIWMTTYIPELTLLANQASPLRKLSYRVGGGGFSGCDSFPWKAPFLRSLNVLDLMFNGGIDAGSMENFLDALSSMPHLQHLQLWNGVYPPSSTSPCPPCSGSHSGGQVPRKVVLQLKTLGFTCTCPMIGHIMEHITFPASTKVTLNMRREPFNPDTEEDPNIGGLKRTCAQLASTFECSSPPPPPFTSVHIMLDYRVAMFNLGALRTPTFSGVTTAEQEWYDADDLRVGRPDVTIKSSFDSVLRNLCTTSKAFLGDEVRLLWYSFEYSFDSDSASIFSVAFPRLSVLRLAYPLPKPVLHDLLCGADESGTISSFPALKVLDFEQCWIQDLIGPPEDATAEAPLFSTLAERQQAGLPVAAVYLRLAEEIDDLQSGCNHSCSEYPDAASVQRAVNALIARPEVKIIGKDHDIPYSMYM